MNVVPVPTSLLTRMVPLAGYDLLGDDETEPCACFTCSLALGAVGSSRSVESPLWEYQCLYP